MRVEITRKDTIKNIKKIAEKDCFDNYDKAYLGAAILYLENSRPNIDAKWIKEETVHGWDGSSYQCSKCGRSVHIDPVVEDIKIDYPYCHCGAKMTGEE